MQGSRGRRYPAQRGRGGRFSNFNRPYPRPNWGRNTNFYGSYHVDVQQPNVNVYNPSNVTNASNDKQNSSLFSLEEEEEKCNVS